MKQDKFTTFLHLPSFMPTLCPASFLPPQESAILATGKCPTSTARAVEIGLTCICSGARGSYENHSKRELHIGKAANCVEEGKSHDMTPKKALAGHAAVSRAIANQTTPFAG